MKRPPRLFAVFKEPPLLADGFFVSFGDDDDDVDDDDDYADDGDGYDDDDDSFEFQ